MRISIIGGLGFRPQYWKHMETKMEHETGVYIGIISTLFQPSHGTEQAHGFQNVWPLSTVPLIRVLRL